MPRGSAAGRESKQTRIVGDPVPGPSSLTPIVKSYYEDVWAELPEDPEPWAWERRRALLLGEAAPGERVLDLGCGAGRFVAALRDAGADPVGVELADGALERARRNVPGADLRALGPDGEIPLEDSSVDLVWCSEVLEHVPDTAGLLSEARRVLKTGGRMLVTTPSHDLPRRAGDRARCAGRRTSTRSASTSASTAAARSRACWRRSRSRTCGSARRRGMLVARARKARLV